MVTDRMLQMFKKRKTMNSIIAFIFIGVAVLFIIGIKLLSSPKTARIGNLVAAAGMFIAFLVTAQNRHSADAYLVAGLDV